MRYTREKEILPEFPRTPTLFRRSDDDVVADTEIDWFADFDYIAEEKLDGANCGIFFDGENMIIRNRKHILNKGYKKGTKAKDQYIPLWGWAYDNIENFKRLRSLENTWSIYGEWLYATHTIHYNQLPAYFIAYDIYDFADKQFLSPITARSVLTDCGFSIPPLLGEKAGINNVIQFLREESNKTSTFSTTEKREGVYVKFYKWKRLTGRLKYVRLGFASQENWTKGELIKNELKGKIV